MKKIILLWMLVFLVIPSVAFAEEDCVIPTSPSAEKLCNVIMDVADILLVFGLALAVVIIIVSGIQYIVAGGNEEQIKKAKKMIINGLIGVAIILASSFLVMMVAEFIIDKFE